MTGLPDVELPDGVDATVTLPANMSDLTPVQLSDELNRYGSLCARANTILGAVDAKVLILKERLDERIDPIVLKLRDDYPKATLAELTTRAFEGDAEAKEMRTELLHARAQQLQAERLLKSFHGAYVMFSRQVGIVDIENEVSSSRRPRRP